MISMLFHLAEVAYESLLLAVATHADKVQRLPEVHTAFERAVH
jgi:hypothetical protein